MKSILHTQEQLASMMNELKQVAKCLSVTTSNASAPTDPTSPSSDETVSASSSSASTNIATLKSSKSFELLNHSSDITVPVPVHATLSSYRSTSSLKSSGGVLFVDPDDPRPKETTPITLTKTPPPLNYKQKMLRSRPTLTNLNMYYKAENPSISNIENKTKFQYLEPQVDKESPNGIDVTSDQADENDLAFDSQFSKVSQMLENLLSEAKIAVETPFDSISPISTASSPSLHIDSKYLDIVKDNVAIDELNQNTEISSPSTSLSSIASPVDELYYHLKVSNLNDIELPSKVSDNLGNDVSADLSTNHPSSPTNITSIINQLNTENTCSSTNSLHDAYSIHAQLPLLKISDNEPSDTPPYQNAPSPIVKPRLLFQTPPRSTFSAPTPSPSHSSINTIIQPSSPIPSSLFSSPPPAVVPAPEPLFLINDQDHDESITPFCIASASIRDTPMDTREIEKDEIRMWWDVKSPSRKTIPEQENETNANEKTVRKIPRLNKRMSLRTMRKRMEAVGGIARLETENKTDKLHTIDEKGGIMDVSVVVGNRKEVLNPTVELNYLFIFIPTKTWIK